MPYAHDDIAHIRTGDPKAFERCFNHHWPALYAFVLRIAGNKDDAKNIVQLVYISLWGKKEKLNIIGLLESYLYQAVRSQAIKN